MWLKVLLQIDGDHPWFLAKKIIKHTANTAKSLKNMKDKWTTRKCHAASFLRVRSFWDSQSKSLHFSNYFIISRKVLPSISNSFTFFVWYILYDLANMIFEEIMPFQWISCLKRSCLFNIVIYKTVAFDFFLINFFYCRYINFKKKLKWFQNSTTNSHIGVSYIYVWGPLICEFETMFWDNQRIFVINFWDCLVWKIHITIGI